MPPDAMMAISSRQKSDSRRDSKCKGVETPLSEISDILATGLMRLRTHKSSAFDHTVGESSLDLSPDRSGDAGHFVAGERDD
jgi:hypothetical protein